MTDNTLSEMDLGELKDWERKLWNFIQDYSPELTIQELYNKIYDAIEGFEP